MKRLLTAGVLLGAMTCAHATPGMIQAQTGFVDARSDVYGCTDKETTDSVTYAVIQGSPPQDVKSFVQGRMLQGKTKGCYHFAPFEPVMVPEQPPPTENKPGYGFLICVIPDRWEGDCFWADFKLFRRTQPTRQSITPSFGPIQ